MFCARNFLSARFELLFVGRVSLTIRTIGPRPRLHSCHPWSSNQRYTSFMWMNFVKLSIGVLNEQLLLGCSFLTMLPSQCAAYLGTRYLDGQDYLFDKQRTASFTRVNFVKFSLEVSSEKLSSGEGNLSFALGSQVNSYEPLWEKLVSDHLNRAVFHWLFVSSPPNILSKLYRIDAAQLHCCDPLLIKGRNTPFLSRRFLDARSEVWANCLWVAVSR